MNIKNAWKVKKKLIIKKHFNSQFVYRNKFFFKNQSDRIKGHDLILRFFYFYKNTANEYLR